MTERAVRGRWVCCCVASAASRLLLPNHLGCCLCALQLAIERVASYVKRLSTLTLCLPPHGALAILHLVRCATTQHPRRMTLPAVSLAFLLLMLVDLLVLQVAAEQVPQDQAAARPRSDHLGRALPGSRYATTQPNLILSNRSRF